MCKSIYRKIFKSLNLSFHTPRRDQCYTCTRYYLITEGEKENKSESFQQHQSRPKCCRKDKNGIKDCILHIEEGLESAMLLNMDLQRVLETPKAETGPIFYKRKLAVYKMTIFNLITKEAHCNLWDQTKGQRGANEVATLMYNILKENTSYWKFYFVTDGCCGQFKNQFVASLFLYAVRTLHHVQEINHIFLESGHSQQEGGSMHLCIERAAKHLPVFSIENWRTVCLIARTNPEPY